MWGYQSIIASVFVWGLVRGGCSSIEGLSRRRSMDYPTNTSTLTSEMYMLCLCLFIFWHTAGRSEAHMVRHPSRHTAAVSSNTHIKYSYGMGDKLLYNMSNILFDNVYILTIYRTMVTIYTTGFSNKILYTFCPHRIFMALVRFSQWAGIQVLNGINRLVFIMETQCFLWGTNWRFKTVYITVLLSLWR
jgi:hypothetical protein